MIANGTDARLPAWPSGDESHKITPARVPVLEGRIQGEDFRTIAGRTARS